MDDLLHHLLAADPAPAPIDSVPEAWDRHRALHARFPRPVEHAAAAGFGADRLGYAFLSGYRAALQALLPQLPPDRTAALCATEEGGGHPRAIRTRFDGETITGTKSFVTLGSFADDLIVIGVGGERDGRPLLRATLVSATAPGVTLTDRPPIPFAPEIPHAVLALDAAPVSEVLPGDGYSRYLKPFRTIEDLHVLSAAIGWLVQVARRSEWPTDVVERLLVLSTSLSVLASTDPTAAPTHIALGGVLTELSTLIDEAPWNTADSETQSRWERDRKLLTVAATVRAKRLGTAWRELSILRP